MTLHEVKQYYGKSYGKILEALVSSNYSYEVDKSCGKYLELTCKGQNGRLLKINHGISNKYPYNVWYKEDGYSIMVTKHFASQKDVVEYIRQL